MLNYVNQYNISNGIFLCFDKELDHRKLTSNHSQQVRDKMKNSFPHLKFEGWTKENFVIMCIYIMFKKKPTSYRGMVQLLHEMKEKTVSEFKTEILNYNQHMARDVDYLIGKYGGKLTVDEIFNEFQQHDIKFYTLWFYLKTINADEESILKTRAKSATFRRIKTLMLYLTFKQENVKKLEKLIKERLDV